MIGIVKSFDSSGYTVESQFNHMGLVDNPAEKITKIYYLPNTKVFETLEIGDIVSFVPGQLYLGGKLIDVASLAKKEPADMYLKKQQ